MITFNVAPPPPKAEERTVLSVEAVVDTGSELN